MDEALDYNKIIEAVDSAGTPSEDASVSIDLSSAFDNVMEVKKLKYEDVSALLEGVEAKKPETAPEVKVQPEVQVQIAVPKHEIRKEMEGAAARLSSMVGGAGREFEEYVANEIEKTREANLVLPTLSVQDQLSDLEKIEQGLAENIFDKEQVGIIIQEVGTLSRIAARENTSGLSEEQKEMVLMRDQKVKEIKDRLHIG